MGWAGPFGVGSGGGLAWFIFTYRTTDDLDHQGADPTTINARVDDGLITGGHHQA
jgi:hypothetical protein